MRSDHLLSVDQLHERMRALQHELDRERIELRLLPGEAPFDGLTEDFHEAADELRTRGFGG